MTPLEQLPIPLLEWYRDNARTLPWRDDPTPYHVWVSEVMLQQTRVAAVLDYYRRFMEEVPDIASLASLPEERLMKLWQGLGYYSRARNLQAAAKQIMSEHGGEFPSEYTAVRSLRGVGDYTAGAICSIAFGQSVPAVDGNVLRVVTRITGNEGDITSPAVKKQIGDVLQSVIPLQAAGQFNQALMELGATVCLPNGAPLCDRCPAREFCTALREDSIGRIPAKPPKKARRIEERTVWLIFRNGRIALRRRPSKGLLAGLWEYPNELSKALPAEWQLALTGERFGCTAKHIFTHIEWHMTARLAQAQSDTLPDGWVWADEAALREQYTLPNAFDGMAHLVYERLKEN